MYAYLSGTLVQCQPTFAILDVGGIGYHLSISLHTYEAIHKKKEAKLFTHLWVKEDNLSLFGFSEEHEKAVFEEMISVSGIGPNTARTVLSTLSPKEVEQAISTGNISLLKSVKGIGAKTAQRMILELQDKIQKVSDEQLSQLESKDRKKEEALQALVLLGFPKAAADKALIKVIKSNSGSDLGVEELIKLTLKSI